MIVYQDSDGDLWCYSTLKCDTYPKSIRILKERPERKHDVVFFTPILSPEPTYQNPSSEYDIDMSTASLIYKDWIDYDKQFKTEELWDDPLIPYKYKNTQRHSHFLSNLGSDVELGQGTNPNKKVQFAKGVFIGFSWIRKDIIGNKERLSSYDNVAFDVRQSAYQIYKLWVKNRIEDQESKSLGSLRVKKSFLLRDFKFSLVLYLLNHIQKSPSYLQEINGTGLLALVSKSDDFNIAFEHFLKFQFQKPFGQVIWPLGRPFTFSELLKPIVDTYESILTSLHKSQLPDDVLQENIIDVDFENNKKILREYVWLQKRLFGLNGRAVTDLLYFESNKGLSAGEKAYLDLLSRIHLSLKTITERIEAGNYDQQELTLYLLIDEGEIGFHLRWQKDYVKDLCHYLPKILRLNDRQIQVQVVFTTHSPVSLSDIPSSHIIYLTRDLSTGSIVAKSDMARLTFGANIQNLMADSFFMEKGTIGALAKEKIESLIEYLKGQEVDTAVWDSNKAGVFIGLIGDSLVQSRLGEMYQAKFDKLPSLEEEEARLRKRLEEILMIKGRFNEED
jgi:hypothetical protein